MQKAYRFEGCKNVTIEGNTYDGGLNAGVELASTEQKPSDSRKMTLTKGGSR